MSTQDPSQDTVLPSTFGTAFIIECDSCGQLEFPARERDRFERMQDVHRTLCTGEMSTHRPSPHGPKA